MSHSSRSLKSEVDSLTNLHKKCAKWNKDELQELLSRKLACRKISKQEDFKEWPDKTKIPNRRLGTTLRSGLYNIPLLKELLRNGMPAESIITAMKYGLVSLNPAELYHFQGFGVVPEVLQNEDLWMKSLDEILIENLSLLGINERQCWHIIVNGLTLQTPRTLERLVLGGIDVAGILNWQNPVNKPSSKVIEFLRQTGIEEHTIELIEEYGIDDETLRTLNVLAECVICDRESMESQELVCKCSSTKVSVARASSSAGTLKSLDYFMKKFACTCYSKSSIDATAERNNYLRQNVMIALTWAMARVLHYRPSDPQHYLAHQLLRWSSGDVSKDEQCEAFRFAETATDRMDLKLTMQKLHEEEEVRRKEALKNIPCEKCRNREEILRNNGCLYCTRVSREPTSCHLPELCSSCKLHVKKSLKTEECDFPEVCSSCKLPVRKTVKVTEECDFPDVCRSCKLPVGKSVKTEDCDIPTVCSSCKLPST